MRSFVASPRCLRAVYLLTVLATGSGATTLVAAWSPVGVTLAADSAVTESLGGLTVQGSACKIGEESGTWFAFSGLVDDDRAGFHVYSLAQAAARAGGSVEIRAQRFVNSIRGPIANAVQALRAEDAKQYAFLQDGHPVLQAIFAGVDAGKPSLVIAGFGLGPSGEMGDFVRVVANGDDGRGPRIVYAGQQQQIRTYMKAHPWDGNDAGDLTRKLIQLEADASKGEVGGPIDVLSVTGDGARWVSRKTGCEGGPGASGRPAPVASLGAQNRASSQ